VQTAVQGGLMDGLDPVLRNKDSFFDFFRDPDRPNEEINRPLKERWLVSLNPMTSKQENLPENG
jgi:hypothetical protein